MKIDLIRCKICRYERTIEAGQMELFFMAQCPKCGGDTERIFDILDSKKKIRVAKAPFFL